MRKIITVCMALLFTVSNVYAEGSRIGFVNINLLLQKAPQALEATKRLEEAFGNRKAEILGFQKSCKEMEGELEREEAALSKQQRNILS